MSGFNKIKLTVINNIGEVIIEDTSPRIIDYQKFYYAEEFESWVEAFIHNCCHTFPEDIYNVTLDTLGSYGKYEGILTISSRYTRSYNFRTK